MNKFTKIDCDNQLEFVEYISALSQLVKCTLAGFGWVYKMESEFISLKNFSYCFTSFLPPINPRIDQIVWEKVFIGKNAKEIINVYKKLLEIYFQVEDFRMPPTAEPQVGYFVIKDELETVDKELDSLIKKIVEK